MYVSIYNINSPDSSHVTIIDGASSIATALTNGMRVGPILVNSATNKIYGEINYGIMIYGENNAVTQICLNSYTADFALNSYPFR